jgi:hypothetical protein
MKEIIDLFANNGIGVACLIYFMFRDYKLMSDLRETMAVVKDYVKKQEKRIERESEDDKK